jgi:hypothetical protein
VGEAQYEATLSPYFGVNVACGIPNPTFGCLDPLASNYNLWADIQVPCVYIGCDDPTAYNYNPLVTIPDNSCAYCDSGTVANVYLCTYGYGSNNSLTLLDDSGDTIYQSPVLGDSQIFQSNVCLQNGTCYTAVMENVTDSSDWNNGYFSISDNNNVYVFSGLVGMSYNEIQFSIDGSCGNVFGCTDTSAVNYDALATVDNGSCVYECMGYNLDVIFFNGYYTGAISFTLSDSTGNVVLEPPLAPANVLNHYQLCVAPGCYTVEMTGYDWTSSTIPSYVSFSCNSGLPQSFFASPQNGGLAYYGVNTIGCGTQTITTCSTNLSLVPYDSSHVDNTVYLLYDQDMSDVTYVYWTLGDGNATTADYPIYYYDNPGNYEVCVHINYSSGCVASSCVSFTVDEFNSYFPNGQGLNGGKRYCSKCRV